MEGRNFRVCCLLLFWSFVHATEGRRLYSTLSCSDFLPRKSSQIKENSGAKPSIETTIATATATESPLNETIERSGDKDDMNITVNQRSLESGNNAFGLRIIFKSGFSYIPGRHHEINITTRRPFAGFIFHVKEFGGEIVGDFINLPPLTKAIECSRGNASRNTVIDSRDPVRMTNITLTWRAPVINTSLQYRIGIFDEENFLRSGGILLASTVLPPRDEETCGRTAVCLRVCQMTDRMCSFIQSVYTVKAVRRNQTGVFTIGARLMNNDNYIALGLTNDRRQLTGMDLSVCYLAGTFQNDAQISHLYLPNRSSKPLMHEKDLVLDDAVIDGDTLWCQFIRALASQNASGIDLTTPKYVFFFSGFRSTDGEVMVPPVRNMVRSKIPVLNNNTTWKFNYVTSQRSRGQKIGPVCTGILFVPNALAVLVFLRPF